MSLRSARTAGWYSSGQGIGSALTPRRPVVCDRVALELAGGEHFPTLMGCREVDQAPPVSGACQCLAARAQWDIDWTPEDLGILEEDPDNRPYLWDLEERCR